MARPAEMAAWVLGGEKKGWSVQRVNDIVSTGKRQVVTLDQDYLSECVGKIPPRLMAQVDAGLKLALDL